MNLNRKDPSGEGTTSIWIDFKWPKEKLWTRTKVILKRQRRYKDKLMDFWTS